MSFTHVFTWTKIPVVFCVPHLHSSSPCGMILWIETSQLWIHRAQPAALWPSSASCGHMLRHRAWVQEPRNRGHRHPVAPKKGSHRTRNLEFFFWGCEWFEVIFFGGWYNLGWYNNKGGVGKISKFSKNHPKPHLIFRKRFYLAKKNGRKESFFRSDRSGKFCHATDSEESTKQVSKFSKVSMANVLESQGRVQETWVQTIGPVRWEPNFLNKTRFFFKGFVKKVWCARCFYFETQNIELNAASQCITFTKCEQV